MTIIEAIARYEGFGANPENIPTRCNNPGDIRAGQFANAHGAIPGAPDPHRPDGGPCPYAVFPTAETGWAALRALLLHHYVGLNVYMAIHRYAPATENDSSKYVGAVCRWTDLLPDAIVTPENIG